jgi:hypothetical protein
MTERRSHGVGGTLVERPILADNPINVGGSFF